jgi:hypothetical protein
VHFNLTLLIPFLWQALSSFIQGSLAASSGFLVSLVGSPSPRGVLGKLVNFWGNEPLDTCSPRISPFCFFQSQFVTLGMWRLGRGVVGHFMYISHIGIVICFLLLPFLYLLLPSLPLFLFFFHPPDPDRIFFHNWATMGYTISNIYAITTVAVIGGALFGFDIASMSAM